MKILVTDSARWQLRTATAALRRRDPRRAESFRNEVAKLLEQPDRAMSRTQPLSDLPGLPFREAQVEGYRLFFRSEGGVLWLVGAWDVPIER